MNNSVIARAIAKIVSKGCLRKLEEQTRGVELVSLLGLGLSHYRIAQRMGLKSSIDVANRIYRIRESTGIPRHKLLAIGVLMNAEGIDDD